MQQVSGPSDGNPLSPQTAVQMHCPGGRCSQSAVVVQVPPSTTNPPDWARVFRAGASLAVMTTPISARKKARREVSPTSFVSRSNVRASIPDYPVGQELCAIVSASIDGPMVLAPLKSQIIWHVGQRIDEVNGHLMPHEIHGAAIAARSSTGTRRMPNADPGQMSTWRPRQATYTRSSRLSSSTAVQT